MKSNEERAEPVPIGSVIRKVKRDGKYILVREPIVVRPGPEIVDAS